VPRRNRSQPCCELAVRINAPALGASLLGAAHQRLFARGSAVAMRRLVYRNLQYLEQLLVIQWKVP
jgi:hypothetical protein